MKITWAYRLILLALVTSAPGCAMSRWMASSPDYKQAQIRYNIQGNLVDEKPRPAPVQPAVAGGTPAMVVQPSMDPAKQYIRTLDLVYPYPADGDKALAVLHITSTVDSSSVLGAGGFARRKDNEILMLELKRHDVDSVLRSLGNDGYFRGETKAQPGVTLTTVIDGQHRTTPWVRSEKLDTLAQRLMAKGKRVDPAKVPEILAAMSSSEPRGNRPPSGANTQMPQGTMPPAAPMQTPPATQPMPGATYPLPEPSSYRHQGASPALPSPAPMPPAATVPPTGAMPGLNQPGTGIPGPVLPGAQMPATPTYPAAAQPYPTTYPQTAAVQPYPATYPQTAMAPQAAYPQPATGSYPPAATSPVYPQAAQPQGYPQTMPAPAYPQTAVVPQASTVPGMPAYQVQ